MSEDNEQTQKKEEGQAGAETSESTGDQQESSDPVKSANEAAKRLEKANEEMRKTLKEQQDLYAQQKLGGKTEGRSQEEKPKEDDPETYSDKALSGSLNEE